MVGREACFVGDGLKRWLLAPVLGDEGERLPDDRIVAGWRGGDVGDVHGRNVGLRLPASHPILAQILGFASAALSAAAMDLRSSGGRNRPISVLTPRERR